MCDELFPRPAPRRRLIWACVAWPPARGAWAAGEDGRGMLPARRFARGNRSGPAFAAVERFFHQKFSPISANGTARPYVRRRENSVFSDSLSVRGSRLCALFGTTCELLFVRRRRSEEGTCIRAAM
jgi:hypothetical protein